MVVFARPAGHTVRTVNNKDIIICSINAKVHKCCAAGWLLAICRFRRNSLRDLNCTTVIKDITAFPARLRGSSVGVAILRKAPRCATTKQTTFIQSDTTQAHCNITL